MTPATTPLSQAQPPTYPPDNPCFDFCSVKQRGFFLLFLIHKNNNVNRCCTCCHVLTSVSPCHVNAGFVSTVPVKQRSTSSSLTNRISHFVFAQLSCCRSLWRQGNYKVSSTVLTIRFADLFRVQPRSTER